jgi:predicted nucleic acid-binding protein
MVNDSVIIASMKQERVKLLATNDKAFEKVREIHVCTPEDIKLS